VSFALSTRNRVSSLERTLGSLRAQEVQPFEIVISDDSDDSEKAAVRAVAERFGCRYVEGPRRGLYANRNHSATHCAGTHVRTVDDDHEFPPSHVSTCLDAVERDPEAIWIIGERLPGQLPSDGNRCPPQLHPRGFSVTPPPGGAIWAIADGATIYPRRLFDEGLRYSEDFPFGASYLEWGSRLHWLGYRIRHLQETHVVHHYDPETRSFLDERVDLSSRFFAMFAHAFLYQRTLRNQALCVGEVSRQVVARPRTALPSLHEALSAYRRQRRTALGRHPDHGTADSSG
jgi:glycosyltransferase involved in cell wall biosynthesis